MGGLVERRPKQEMDQQLWTCPDCGNRFVTKKLWHSCGRFSLEDLFASAEPQALDLARQYVRLLETVGDVEVIPQRTRLTALARVRFAGAVPRKKGFIANFALRHGVEHDRIVKVERHGPNWWTHHVRIESENDLDDQLRYWLQESYDTVGLQRS